MFQADMLLLPIFRAGVSRLRKTADYTGSMQDGNKSVPQEGRISRTSSRQI